MHLNPTHCDGYRVCAQVLPEAIALDEWGFPILGPQEVTTGFEHDRRSVEIPENLTHLAHRAVVSCPRLALHLEE